MVTQKMLPELTADRLRELLYYAPETGVFTWRVNRGSVRSGAVAGTSDGNGYVQIRVSKRHYRAHRLAWLYTYGVWPDGLIDHRNRDRADNRITNLRGANDSQNVQNTTIRSDNSSGYRGVYWHKRANKWAAEINAYGRQRYLGLFESPDAAQSAYLKAAEELHTHNPLVTTQASTQPDQPAPG